MKLLQWFSTVLGIPAAVLTIASYLVAAISWFSPEIESVGDLYISPGLLQTCSVAVAISGTLVFAFVWIKDRIAVNRRAQEAETERQRLIREAEKKTFRQLVPDLQYARAAIRLHINRFEKGHFSVESELSSALTAVLVKLKSVGLKSPPLSIKSDEQGWQRLTAWEIFLDFIVPLAELGDLNEARRVATHEGGWQP